MYESQKGIFPTVFYNQKFTAQENAKVSRKKLLFSEQEGKQASNE